MTDGGDRLMCNFVQNVQLYFFVIKTMFDETKKEPKVVYYSYTIVLSKILRNQ